MTRRLDLVGKKYGRLFVEKYSHTDRNRQSNFIVQCECGNKKVVAGSSIKSGHTKSCGCYSREIKRNYKHGKSYNPAYRIWANMKSRCFNLKCDNYKDYGGRGITVCDKWLHFKGFYEDMGDRPEGLTLERINNDKGYNSDNCHWSTPVEQANNRRDNVILIHNGISLTVSQWARKLRINRNTIYTRIYRGWNTQRILATL